MATPQVALPANALGHAQLTVSTTVALLPDPPSFTRRTVIRVLDQPVNWTDVAAQEPEGDFGMPLLAGETLVFDGDPNHLKLIRAAAATGDADVRIAFYH